MAQWVPWAAILTLELVGRIGITPGVLGKLTLIIIALCPC